MKLNLHIIKDELSDLKITDNLNNSIECSLNSVCIFEYSTYYDPELLYLCDSYTYKSLHNIAQNLKFVVIRKTKDQAIDLNPDIIVIETKFELHYILNRINRIFAKFQKWELDLLSCILKKSTLEDFFNKAAEVFPNPMYIMDENDFLRFYAGKLPQIIEGTLWELFFKQGYLDFNNQALTTEYFKYYEHALTSTRATWDPSKMPYPHMYANIFISGKYCGVIGLTDTNVSFSYGQLSLLEVLRKIVISFLSSNSNNYLFINTAISIPEKIMTGNMPSDESITMFLKKINWHIDEKYYMIVLQTDTNESDRKFEEYTLLNISLQFFKQALAFVYNEKNIIILRDIDYPYRGNEIKKQLQRLDEISTANIAVSMPFYDLKRLPGAFHQCRLTLDEHTSKVSFFEDNYFSLFTHISQNVEKSIFADQRLVMLKDYDKKNNTELLKTILYYLKYSQNAIKTAKEMYVHRNTIRYRLQKIEEITHIHFEYPENIDYLLFSCMLLNM